jgi:hypothetical protein
MNSVIIQGIGPHVRFKTSTKASLKVFTGKNVVRVPLEKTTDVNFVRPTAA